MESKSLTEVLLSIFQGESNAANRYSIFSKSTKNKAIQKIFATTSLAERIHAEKMRKLALRSGLNMSMFTPKLAPVTADYDLENLKMAIKGEVYESTILYPELAQIAMTQNNKYISDAVTSLGKVESEHAKLFQDAIDTLLDKEVEVTYYLCPSCGHIYKNRAPDKCEMCGGSGRMFQKY